MSTFFNILTFLKEEMLGWLDTLTELGPYVLQDNLTATYPGITDLDLSRLKIFYGHQMNILGFNGLWYPYTVYLLFCTTTLENLHILKSNNKDRI